MFVKNMSRYGLSSCLLVCLSVCLSVCLFVCLFVRSFVLKEVGDIFVCLSVFPTKLESLYFNQICLFLFLNNINTNI